MREKETFTSVILFGPECPSFLGGKGGDPRKPFTVDVLRLFFDRKSRGSSKPIRESLLAEANQKLAGLKKRTLPVEELTASDLAAVVFSREPAIPRTEVFLPRELHLVLGWEGDFEFMRKEAEAYMSIPHHELIEAFITHVRNKHSSDDRMEKVESEVVSRNGIKFGLATYFKESLTTVGPGEEGYGEW